MRVVAHSEARSPGGVAADDIRLIRCARHMRPGSAPRDASIATRKVRPEHATGVPVPSDVPYRGETRQGCPRDRHNAQLGC